MRCTKPKTPQNLSITPMQPFYVYQDKITYECDEGYVIRGFSTDTCGSDGEFSGQIPSCESKTIEFLDVQDIA